MLKKLYNKFIDGYFIEFLVVCVILLMAFKLELCTGTANAMPAEGQFEDFANSQDPIEIVIDYNWWDPRGWDLSWLPSGPDLYWWLRK